MLIGLAYDLRDDYRALGLPEEQLAEFDSPETIAELEAALSRLGHRVDRIGNVRRLAERLVAGDRWDLVFNICEGLSGRSREAQVPALLEAFGQPYTFADPLVMAATLDKAVAKRLVRDHGLPTAPFALVAHPSDIARVDLPFPLFVKPVAEGTGKGVSPASLVRSRRELERACAALLLRFAQPVLVESFLPGREFTVGILGTGARARVLGTLEIELLPGAEPGVYSYANKERCEEFVRYVLVDDDEARAAAELALACYRALECRDAGRVDLRSDASGRPQFLEVNPLAGLHPTHSDLPILARKAGLSYDALIGAIVESAAERAGLVGTSLRRAGR
ncbi:MAG: D-alanine--D-alanine ligase [Geminicoccaceae bacterium]|nr:D-alanine--D-alanine ligase [Geminicoccaceae bacterium]MCS7268304.1 D-alanine--D-alanine ligase [Geminicoccaceae bacterium]MCX7629191.1 D-alanine--D-alanine ligase [Geminicoccaceae bacterium]MDW8125531.1 D-alanine--D-alanine ligase [Geminicoccaceae bacterium]MDW8341331.1 D-alanine--D-alanine ligase [Geminicoccaceae bacterium]